MHADSRGRGGTRMEPRLNLAALANTHPFPVERNNETDRIWIVRRAFREAPVLVAYLLRCEFSTAYRCFVLGA